MMWGFLRRNKFSIKPRLVFDTAGGTTKRRVPHPLRSWQRVGYATVGIEIGGIPPFAKSAKGGAPRGFVALPRTRNAPFHIPRSATPVDDLRKAACSSMAPPSSTGNPGSVYTNCETALIDFQRRRHAIR
jgi:hypothetical protein